MGFFDFLGLRDKANNIDDFITKDALIIDVRSSGEFSSGHVKGAKNIPLNSIESKINEIKKLNKPIITCCASGMRSAQAASILKKNEIEVVNGGGWRSLESKLQNN